MRYFLPLLTACSGIAVAAACAIETPITFASEPSPSNKIAAMTMNAGTADVSAPRVVCSRNRPIQFSDVTKVASAGAPSGLSFAANKIVQLFCRDVRINTIVVRDYCAVIRG
jgi:hypothetical protein